MSKKAITINEIHCDRCPTYLGREILQGKKVKKREMVRESKGEFSMTLGGHTHSYKDVCPRCFDILEKLIGKAGPVMRGRSRKPKK